MEDSLYATRSLTRTASINVPANLRDAFALFGPVKEQEWADGWQPQIIYPTTGVVEEHMVFRTSSVHGPAEGAYTWVISKYQPEQALIEYTVFTTERLWWITIQCHEDGSDDVPSTSAEINYTYIGLTEPGQAMNEHALQRMFAHDLRDWEQAIRHYLTTGERLS